MESRKYMYTIISWNMDLKKTTMYVCIRHLVDTIYQELKKNSNKIG